MVAVVAVDRAVQAPTVAVMAAKETAHKAQKALSTVAVVAGEAAMVVPMLSVRMVDLV
jgi:hypothetical protein